MLYYLEECNEDEIIAIISNFGNRKSSGPNSIPTNLLKEFVHHFAKPLKLIINKSLAEGVFPSLLEIALIVLFLKRMIKPSVPTIGQFPSYQTLVNCLKA